MEFEARWREMWRGLCLEGPNAELLQLLLTRYREPWRAYHTTQHLLECFAHFDFARHLASAPAEIEFALWFHDAVYDPRREDNEEASAKWAEQVLLRAGATEPLRARVHALIMATKHDTAPTSHAGALIVDVDLAILGASEARFDEYETQVRQEYAWVPAFIFRRRRAQILEAFLERNPIYRTALFQERFEALARGNLRRALARLA